LKGDTPEVTASRILGHEAVGTLEEVGSGVKSLAVCDRVLVSCISACGVCRFCREGHYGQRTGGGGWILGHLIDGTQAEYVRVPFADTSTYRLPAGASDEEILMIADILPNGYEVGVLNGHVQPGDTVAVVGTGPIGLSAITGARMFSLSHVIAIDLADARLEAAKAFGADLTFNNSNADAAAYVCGLTDGLGAVVAIEAVGVPASFELRPGGHVANIEAPLARAGNGVGGGGHQGGRRPSRRVRPRVPHHDHLRSGRLCLGLRPFLGVRRGPGQTRRLPSPLPPGRSPATVPSRLQADLHRWHT
jgi:alcohol dehydrogenase